MKKIIYFLLATVFVVGCSRELESPAGVEQVLEFSISGVSDMTGKASSVTTTESWTEGEQVLIWQVSGSAANTLTGVYTITGLQEDLSAELTYESGTEFTGLANSRAIFYALYPYSEDLVVEGSGVCFTSEHLATDYLFSETETLESVEFTFGHLFSQIGIEAGGISAGTDNRNETTTAEAVTIADYDELEVTIYNTPSSITGLGAADVVYDMVTKYIGTRFTIDVEDVGGDDAYIYVFVDPSSDNQPIFCVNGTTETNGEQEYGYQVPTPIEQGEINTYSFVVGNMTNDN